MPQEQYQAISEKLSKKIAEDYPEKEGFSGEELESLRKNRVSRESFYIVKNDDGSYALQRYDLSEMAEGKRFAEIDLSQTDLATLEATVLDSMQAHRNYDRFHSNGILTATDIEKALDLTTSSIEKQKISMREVVTNAINSGITAENVETTQNIEAQRKTSENETSRSE